MKVILHTVNTQAGPDHVLATLTVNAAGHAVCDPAGALEGLLRDSGLDLAGGRHVRMTDGGEFLRALLTYPLGSYTYATSGAESPP